MAGGLGDLLCRCSDWMKLKRAIVWLMRFKQHLRKHVRRFSPLKVPTGALSVQDLKTAERDIVRYVQKESFPEEMTQCAGAKSAPAQSSLRKLTPRLDDHDVLCVGGRLDNARLNEETKHPMILPTRHHVTDLLIKHYHTTEGHCGQEHVLASLRSSFWVVHGRTAVRRVIGKCLKCRKRTAPAGVQFMASLPEDRLKPDRAAFTYVGVDCFGPMQVKQGRSTVPRYGCLFTCLVCRAVHIEIVHSLDTDSFIHALVRFISRRGRPEIVHSDNGTNFRSGERELSEALNNRNQDKISDHLAQQEITWIFNPPGASHHGGVWERMVRSVKTILRMFIGQQLLTDEALITLIAEVERILNDRPLTAASDDPKDLEPLTPNHLLLHRPASCMPLGTFSEKDSYSRRRWRQIQYLADVFWARWLKEYLPLLQVRQKWFRPQRNLKEGDLVLVCEPNTHRGKWPLARVTAAYPGADGLVRSVQIKTKNSWLERPISKLCFLEETGDVDTAVATPQVETVETNDVPTADSAPTVDPDVTAKSDESAKSRVKTPDWSALQREGQPA